LSRACLGKKIVFKSNEKIANETRPVSLTVDDEVDERGVEVVIAPAQCVRESQSHALMNQMDFPVAFILGSSRQMLVVHQGKRRVSHL
jgi:hypothetical protein